MAHFYDGPLKPIPKDRVLAPRYDVFITAFEKAVTAAQERIEKLRSLEGVYSLVRDVMLLHQLPNDHHLLLDEGGVRVTIEAIGTDSIKTFETIAGDIGRKLLERKLHHDGLPSVGDLSTSRQWMFNIRSLSKNVKVDVNIPPAGIIDIEVVSTIRHYSFAQHTLRDRQTPICITNAAPAQDIPY